MKTLTEAEVAPIWRKTVDDAMQDWTYRTKEWRDWHVTFANAILAKYGVAPSGISERDARERERAAWDAGIHFRCPLGVSIELKGVGGHYQDECKAERDRLYPLPSSPPAPVLTDDEVASFHVSGPDMLPYLVRHVERAVLTKLAQQEPPAP